MCWGQILRHSSFPFSKQLGHWRWDTGQSSPEPWPFCTPPCSEKQSLSKGPAVDPTPLKNRMLLCYPHWARLRLLLFAWLIHHHLLPCVCSNVPFFFLLLLQGWQRFMNKGAFVQGRDVHQQPQQRSPFSSRILSKHHPRISINLNRLVPLSRIP